MADERLWPTDPTPGNTNASDSSLTGISLGTVFVVTSAGNIKGAYVYVADSPPQGVCRLLLYVEGSGVVANEIITIGSGGWTQFLFSSPVAVDDNDQCIIYYHQLAGGDNLVHYAFTSNIFSVDVDSAHMHAPDSTEAGGLSPINVDGNGVFQDTVLPAAAHPASTFGSSSYWVDPIFEADDSGSLLLLMSQLHNPYNGGTL